MDTIKRSTSGNEDGFTLLELMVALIILGIVFSMIYSLLMSGSRMWHRGEERIDLQQNLRVGMDYMLRDIRASGGVKNDSTVAVLKLYHKNDDDIEYRLNTKQELVRDKNGVGLVASGINSLKFQYQPSPPQLGEVVRVTITLRAGEFQLVNSASVRIPD